jgi:ELWxxDGT repeat protein
MANSHRRTHLQLITTCFVVTALGLVATPTQAQVTLVEDINPGAGGTYIFRAGALGNAIYFNAYDGVHGEELWVSDGTPEGTYLVADIWRATTTDASQAYSSNSQQFLAGPSGMYFMAAHREEPDNPPIHDINLWLSNGNPGNASIVPSFELALVDSLANAVIMNGDLMITGWDETNGTELWKVSGTTATRLTDIEPGVGGSSPNNLTVVGSQLFFQATNSATSGIELWVSDGTAGGETLIDIVSGVWSSSPTDVVAFDGKAYFQAYTEEYGAELWRSDGSEIGTVMVADIAPGYNQSSVPMNLVAVGDQLFFTASDDATYNYDLWVYDGAQARKVKADGTPSVSQPIAFDGRLFFVANDPDAGSELWVSDGTDEGTGLLHDVYPGSYTVGEDTYGYSSNPDELTVAGDFLFFTADDGTHGPSLWVTDGTGAGTFMVANLFDDPTEEGPKGLTATTDRLFFQTESDLGREVHALPTANVVKPPAAPTGEASGSTETAYTYSTTGGSASLDGESVQYRFHWGDGESSDWLAVGVTSAEYTWTEAGTYDVTVEARSTAMTSVTSNHSAPLAVLMSFTETVDVSITSGPESGEIWVEYNFEVAGSSDYDHALEYMVSWDDGESTTWAAFNAATGKTLTHDWDSLGEKTITVSLRCAEHTDVTDSVQHWITIEEETIATPTIEGPTTGWTDFEYNFTIGGSSSAGHDLQHIVYWGDGSDTGWQPFGAGQTSAQVSHTWTVTEPFPVEVGVRCATHDHLQAWNSSHSIDITAPPEEEVTGPQVVRPDSGYPDVSYAVTISASSNLGHDLEYQVDWGDGTPGITWTPFGDGLTSVELSHSWEAAATYPMFFEVRCVDHPEKYASAALDMFVDGEVVSEISLAGPSSGAAGVSMDYVLTGRSASGHPMQYYMDWGDAQTGWLDIDPATGTVDLSHTWPADGTYHIQYGVRCSTHNDVQEWSETWVTILGETMATHTLDGPAEGQVGVDLEFTVTATSSDGHDLEYKFASGDGFPTDWAPLDNGSDTAVTSYAWAYPDEFTVTSSVRCATHTHVLSEQTQVVTIAFEPPPGEVFSDGFESGDTTGWSGLVP